MDVLLYAPEQEPALIQASQNGDRRAFDALCEHYWLRIYSYLRLRTGDCDDAEDLAQETFLRAWLGLPKWEALSPFPAWLYTIAHNALIDWYKRRARGGLTSLEELQEQLPAACHSVEQSIEARISVEFLLRQLDMALCQGVGAAQRLGKLRKLAFVYFYADQLTLPQIEIELASHTAALHLTAPTRAQLNNWLSRGDILSQLMLHLLRHHPDWISAVVKGVLEHLVLTPQDAEIARLRWQNMLSAEDIAAQLGLRPVAVSQAIESLIHRVSAAVTARVKTELHATRKCG